MDPWLAMKYSREAVEFYLLQADQALSRHVVMISGQVAGVLAVRGPWLFGPLIELMALFDGYRSRGVGKKIVEWTAQRCEAKNLWVTVSSDNFRAQKFYERQGFRKTALLEDLIKPGWDEILLRKRIARP
ncbi:MAG: GNAT family N-acetyltransferase [Syntrophobacteraceae bacterium]|nr:GNAT family N-acetyltransferase [Syntrophobacteraceae bacterium]